MFANKLMNVVYVIKSNSYQKLSCLLINVVIIFVSFMC